MAPQTSWESGQFGRGFEHFLIEEIRAYLAYKEKFLPTAYWRTSTGLEVDLVIGDLDLAIEFKISRQVDERHIKGLQGLMEDQKVREAVVVSQDPVIRLLASSRYNSLNLNGIKRKGHVLNYCSETEEQAALGRINAGQGPDCGKAVASYVHLRITCRQHGGEQTP